MKHRIKAFGLLIAVLLLSGCMRIEAVITFEKGLMTTAVDLYASKEVISLDQEMQELVGDRKLKDLSAEERTKLCTLFAESDDSQGDDVKVTVEEKGVDDKDRLVCHVKSEAVKPDNSKLPYTITYDEAKGIYTVKGDVSKFLGNDGTLDQEQLKQMGAEMAINFSFAGEIKSYTFDGKNELPAGVTKPDSRTLRVDLLNTSATTFTIEGSERPPLKGSAPQQSLVLPLVLAGAGTILVAGLAWRFLRRRPEASTYSPATSLPEDEVRGD